MDLGLTGRTAIVCGASSGLGLAVAEALAEEGANVVMFARRGDVLEREAKRIGAVAVVGDVREAADIERVVRTAVDTFGGVEEIVELDLSDQERTWLQESADAVREVVGVLTA